MDHQKREVIHLNAAGAAIRSPATTAAMIDWLSRESKVGAYEMVSTHGKDLLDRPYRELASLLGCDEQEISIVTSATEAWNEIVHGVAWTIFKEGGGGIVTAINEYSSNYLTYLQLKERFKVDIHVLGETEDGDVDVDELERLIEENKVVLVTLPHVGTNSGKVYDVRRVGEVTRRHGVLFLLDACQSVGQLAVRVDDIGCDMLTGTSRKWLRGPRGCGFLYCSARCRQLFEPATIDVHSAVLESLSSYAIHRDSRMFEKYEASFAAKVGLGVAVGELNEIGIGRVQERILSLASTLRAMLSSVDGVKVEDRARSLCGIVSFSVEGRNGETAKAATERVFEQLVSAGFSVSISRRTSTMIEMSQRGVECVIRISPHIYNTESELRSLVDAVVLK